MFFITTTAVKNFLLNACSVALIGDESFASWLRNLISIEFYLNAEYYYSHPHIEKVL